MSVKKPPTETFCFVMFVESSVGRGLSEGGRMWWFLTGFISFVDIFIILIFMFNSQEILDSLVTLLLLFI